MDVTPYADRLREQLEHAAALGDDHLREGAQRVLLALDPAVRLAFYDALAAAAAEISTELPEGSVEARLHHGEVSFRVDVAEVHPADRAAEQVPAAEPEDDEGDLARLTVRLPEPLKAKAEEAATRRGQSLNAWLVGVIRAVTVDPSAGPPGPIPPGPGPRPGHPGPHHGPPGGTGKGPWGGRRVTGWA